ncbi:MAG: ABC transporter ATP-binding protein [Opitutaceae bacterium]|nr:ABC transporter ATP-binding protein [Opitutaceae bacterium]
MVSDGSSQFQLVWRLMRGQRLRYTAAIAALLLATGFNYLVPLVGTVTIDSAVAGRPAAADPGRPLRVLLALLGGPEHLRTHLWLAPAAMVILTALGGVFAYLKGRHAAIASDGIARRLKDDLYDHLNHLPARYHDRIDTGDLVQRCTSDVETLRQFLAVQVMELANAALLAAAALPLMLALSPRLTAVSFALIGPLVLYGYVYFGWVRHVFKGVDEAEGALTAVIQENLTGIRVVRAFARQDHERAKFAGPNAVYRDRNLRLLRLMAWYWSISDFVTLCQIGLTLLVGAHWITTGDLSVGVLFAFLAYLGTMLWPVRQMGRILTEVGKTSVALRRIREILDEVRESGSEAGDWRPEAGTAADQPRAAFDPVSRLQPPLFPALPPLCGAIVVRDLHFTHATAAGSAGRGTLNGLSFDVAAGETLAILGPSGSGKSTFIHLLVRLYDYTEGSIRLDGLELSTLPRPWVRRQIGTVMQEPFLFSKTLGDNIRLGRGDAPDHDVTEAARAACIHDTILGFEAGYDTLIGERGITLSGGQRQRVALARAILKHPPILILDDALSAVDSETETLIIDALKARRGRATTLVIAHRLSTLAHADRVLVLDHGRIIQTGPPSELARLDGFYRRLWQIQTSLAAEFTQELNAG